MFFLIALFVLVLLFFIKNTTHLSYVVIVPLSIVICIISFSFSRVSLETEVLDDNPLPFGSVTGLSSLILIEERDKEESQYAKIFTTISVVNHDLFSTGTDTPRVVLQPGDTLKLNILLDKNYYGDYELYLPTISNTEVFDLIAFEADTKQLALDAENPVGSSPRRVLIRNNGEQFPQDEHFSITVQLKKDVHQQVTPALSKETPFEDANFYIGFQNGNRADEQLNLVIQ